MIDFIKTIINAVKSYINSKKLSEFENDLPRPNWSQNDPSAPDYINERPFHTSDEEFVNLIPKTVCNIGYDNYMIPALTKHLIVGKTYYVTFDDVEYECVAREYTNDYDTKAVILGNGTFDSGYGWSFGDGNVSNDEPFLFESFDGSDSKIYSSKGSHTLSISCYNNTISKLDDKYLPYADITWDKIGMKVINTVRVEEQTITFSDSGAYAEVSVTMSEVMPYKGQTCIVTFDGVEYVCTCRGGEDADIEFTTVDGKSCVIWGFGWFNSSHFSGEQHTVKLVTLDDERPLIINDKYLPKELARAKDHLTTVNPRGSGSFIMNSYNEDRVGYGSASFGTNNITEGVNSFSAGYYNEALGENSVAMGKNTIVNSRSQHVIGEFNSIDELGEYYYESRFMESMDFYKTYSLYVSDSYTYDSDVGDFKLINPISCKGNTLKSTIDSFDSNSIYITTYSSETINMYFIDRSDGKQHGVMSGSYAYIYNVEYYSSGLSKSIRCGYAHIVGNGKDRNNRSNAHTLDWNGNAWFAGDIYLGGTGQDDSEAIKLMDFINTRFGDIESICDEVIALQNSYIQGT